jgi:hypothetical protein
MGAPVCPDCGDATRKHDEVGCRAVGCFCGQTRATLAGLDELPAPAPAVFVEPEPVVGCAYCRAFTVGSPQTEHLVCECEEWCGDARCSHHPEQVAAEARFLAERAPTDSPAGVDGAHGVAHRPGDDLPGTSPAPDANGHEASPVRGGEEEDPAVEAQTPAVTAGPVPFGTTYLCPDLHARCRCTPIRWRVLLERITDGE